jgi:nucleoside-diphosphate-sugar epimerase
LTGAEERTMLVLVTGAGGFIGSHAVDQLLAEGKRVRALVRDAARGEPLRQRGVEVVVGDVRAPESLPVAVQGVDVVLHCAAAVGPHFSKREIYETNLGGVRHVLDAVQRAGRGRVVLVSSVNVLGTRHLDPATEDTPCRRSHDPAADVKIEAEQLAQSYLGRGVDVVIVRPPFVYGPGDPHNIPKLAHSIRRGKFRFIGSRHNVVPIVHVSDAVQALLRAAALPAAHGRIYNVSDGSRTTIGQLVEWIAESLGCPPPQKGLPFVVPQLACALFDLVSLVHKVQPPVTRAALRFVGTSRYVDISRARRELGYVPQVGPREGITASVRWYQDHLREAIPAASQPA